MTLQQLQYFKTACKYKNISMACEELHVSQPSVSVAIKNLEREFGCTFFKRDRIGFTLTKEGEELLTLASSLLDHAKDVEDTLHDLRRGASNVKFGIPPMASAILLPQILSELSKDVSAINVSTKEGSREELIRLIDDNLIDVALLPHDRDFSAEYCSVMIREFETVCCVWDGHRLSGSHSVTPKELCGEPLVLFSDGYFQNERLEKIFKSAGVTMSVSHRSSQLSTIRGLIANRVAVGFMFREIAEGIDGVKALALNPPIKTKISLVYKKERQMKPGTQRFIEFMKKLYL